MYVIPTGTPSDYWDVTTTVRASMYLPSTVVPRTSPTLSERRFIHPPLTQAMTDQSLWSILRDARLETALTGSAVVILLAALIGSTIVLQKKQSAQKNWLDELKTSREKEKTQRKQSGPIHPAVSSGPVDVWAERLAKGVAPASLNRKSGAGEDKPFGSSYYYAHNNSKTTGGYKDGLRMEDYTMNGPRLLSRNGSAVSLEDSATAVNPSSTANEGKDSDQLAQQRESKSKKTILTISKYLWDDSPSFGTILVEQLPLQNGDHVAWKDANVLDHRAELKDNGLLVHITSSDSYDYRLHIRTLYAHVTDVVTVVAKSNKRLSIKLTKTKRQEWPCPQAK